MIPSVSRTLHTKSRAPGRFLIVNADDFGYYKAADEGIIKAVQDGIVTSATVVVNMPNARVLPELIKNLPEISLGLHFNLTHGKPVEVNVPTLTSADGLFCHTAETLAQDASTHDIMDELHAQLKLFEDIFKKKPSHIDTHKHIHRKLNVLSALSAAAKENSLPVRSNSPYVHYVLKHKDVRTTDYFFGDVSVSPFWTREKLAGALHELPEGVTELMCHPGYTDKAGEYIGFYNAQREGELMTLCDKEILNVLQSEDIQLINFNNF